MFIKLNDKISVMGMLQSKHSMLHLKQTRRPCVEPLHCYWFAVALSTETTILLEYPPLAVIEWKKASPPLGSAGKDILYYSDNSH